MMYSAEHNMILVTPVKTGSASFQSYFRNKLGGVDIGKTHEATEPGQKEVIAETKIILAVRNPYRRLMSMWWRSCADPTREKKCRMYGLSFINYLRLIQQLARDGEPQHPTGYVYEPLWRYLRRCEAVGDTVPVYYETGYAEIQRILPKGKPEVGLPKPEPAEPWKTIDHPRELSRWYGPAERRALMDYCEKDFGAFSYPTELI